MMRSVVLRLVGALLLAMALIVGLEWWLREAEPPEVEASWRPATASASAATEEAARRARRSMAQRKQGELFVAVDRVMLCRYDNIPAVVSPVLAVQGDGELVVLRAPPLPTQPGRPRVRLAALALPEASLEALTATQRACVLDGLAQMWAERPVDPSRLLLRGVTASRGEIGRLLGWLR